MEILWYIFWQKKIEVIEQITIINIKVTDFLSHKHILNNFQNTLTLFNLIPTHKSQLNKLNLKNDIIDKSGV